MGIKFKWHRDEDGELHCWNRHMLDEHDVREAFTNYESEGTTGDALYRIGYLEDGTRIRVVFKWDEPGKKAFIITAYPFDQ
jgi:hypothetical protein